MLLDRFKVVGAALKVVGVGSVGTRCFVVLLLAAPDDPLFSKLRRPGALFWSDIPDILAYTTTVSASSLDNA